ncbi:MAG: argininosuccinate lyase [Deltaproteobacteria bacterium]|nr:argininosuccinate lyase [Deltaproteobacteria bacterium]
MTQAVKVKSKAWSGRFAEGANPLMEAFTSSLHFDKKLAPYDIRGSIAHCQMLVKQKILSRVEGDQIVKGLRAVEQELRSEKFVFLPSDEDIHMAIERRLTERVGPVGGKLHTARSRNDQVLLDVRLYLRDEIANIIELLSALQNQLARMAKRYRDLVIPGYTHLQRAQPVTLAHHLLAYYEMFGRDNERLQQCRERVNVLPLGAGALAGTTLPIDRHHVAKLLKFPRVSENSLDTVADRDFLIEFLSAGAVLGMHLSRMAEELVLWASSEFGFIELPDAFATGSSMMPQKKNPDVAELIRGKTGRVYGNLVALLTILKGLPLSYNRDLQEDKEPMFDTVDTLKGSLEILAAMLPRLVFREDRLREAALGGFTLATDVADYLVEKGLPFRQAHEVVGEVVRWCLDAKQGLEELSLEQWKRFSPLIERDILPRMTLESAVDRRRSYGGTARSSVQRRLRMIGV